MKVVILAGGMGTRLQEQTETRPKPMVEIGGKPILWHIMKHFSHHEFSDFYIALGYLGDFIKEYFLARYNVSGHLSIDFATGQVRRRDADQERWSVNLVETGSQTMTGGRLKRLQSWLGNETFMLTYGDGVSDINLHELTAFHRSQEKLVTLTAVRPPARFGGLTIQNGVVTEFAEKPAVGEGWINGGFMVMEPGVFDYLTDDTCVLEAHVLERVAADGQLAAYQHEGFWQCMDTLRDKIYLQKQWSSGQAPWRTWPKDAGESSRHNKSAA